MPVPLFKTSDERKLALVAGAAVAMHALIANGVLEHGAAGGGPLQVSSAVTHAFNIAEAFLAEAERRLSQP